VEEPEDAVEKAKHQKDSIRAQRIIADSIKDHLIPYVSRKEHQSEDESHNTVEEYQDAERRNDSIIFLLNLSNKKTV
jgi:hypothetical protein